MRYGEVDPISREEAEAAFVSADTEKMCGALVRITYHDSDYKWVQDQCLDFCRHHSADVRGVAVTCLGHLARIHGKLDIRRVKTALMALREDPAMGGRVVDALDDIKMFMGVEILS